MARIGANSTPTPLPQQPYDHGEIHYDGKNGYAKTSIVDFPPGKLAKCIQSYFRWGVLLYRYFSGGKFYYGSGYGGTSRGKSYSLIQL